MSLLWGLMNTMQMVVSLQLLQVVMPANAQMFMGFVNSLVSFQLLKTIMQGAASDSGDTLKDLKNQSLLKNLETALYIFLVVGVLIGAAFGLWFIRNRFPW